MKTKERLDTPRIYAACLASYNAGTLHGKWIDATEEVEEIWNEIRDMLATSPSDDAEEWAIHDYEGFGSLRLTEWEGVDRVSKLASFIGEHPEFGSELLAHFGGCLEDAENALDDYIGEYRSFEDYARELTEETTQVPPSLEPYIDYTAMGRDIRLNGEVFAVETSLEALHLFWNR